MTPRPEFVLEIEGAKFVCREGTNDGDIVRSVFSGEYALPNQEGYQPGAFCLDVGAHIGAFTVWAARKYHDARVVSVEPMGENQNLFLRNMEANHLSDRVTLLRGAAWSKKEPTVTIPYGDDSTESGRIHYYMGNASSVPHSGQSHVIVRTISLKEIMAGIDRVWCMKCDCENGEYPLLEEARPEDLQRCKWIVGEYHSGIERIQTVMAKTGFREHPAARAHEMFLFENPQTFAGLC